MSFLFTSAALYSPPHKQVFWRPLMIAYSFVLVNLFRGKSLLEIKNILKESFPTTVGSVNDFTRQDSINLLHKSKLRSR